MAKDFRTSQIRTSKIIASGSGPSVMIYSSSAASDYDGGVDADLLMDVGKDVFFFVSGAIDGRTQHPDAPIDASVTLFGGDVYVSGTLHAVSSSIMHNEVLSGSLWIDEELHVSGSAHIAGSSYFGHSINVSGSNSDVYKSIKAAGKFVSEFSQTYAGGLGLYVNRNVADQGTYPLVEIHDSHTSNRKPALRVTQDGRGEILDARSIGGVSKFNISSQGDVFAQESLNVSGSAHLAQNLYVSGAIYSAGSGGQLLGLAVNRTAVAAGYQATTSWATVDSGNMSWSFTAPQTGNVELSVQVYVEDLDVGGSTNTLYAGISDNSVYNALNAKYERIVDVNAFGYYNYVLNMGWIITGLTPLTSYTYYLGVKATVVDDYKLWWGGSAADGYPDMIMKVTSLPSSFTDNT